MMFEEDTLHDFNPTLFAEVILPLSLGKTFTYRIAAEWNQNVVPGQRVIVPFGKRKLYAGMVLSIHKTPPKSYEAKYIHTLLDDEPLLDETHLKFWVWLAAYYMCNLGDVMAAALPYALKLASDSRIELNKDYGLEPANLDERESLVISTLKKTGGLAIDDVVNQLKIKQPFKVIKSLFAKNLILPVEEIGVRYKPKVTTLIGLCEDYASDEALSDLLNQLEKRAYKQCDVLMRYLQKSPKKEFIKKEQLGKDVNNGALKQLINKGILLELKVLGDRLQAAHNETQQFELSDLQQKASASIRALFQTHETVLLHGITGSGKSYVYFDLIKEQLNQGGQVLYLLPEIALTIQLLVKLRSYFGKSVYITHSKFNENERVEVFQKVSQGEPLVLLGPRSAVFLPFRNLKLVIIDEEHEPSFKQQDPAPRYHGRDAAIYLAHLCGAKTVLGSATPSFESFQHAKTEKYGYVVLKNRYADAQLPDIELIDMSYYRKKGQVKSVFSKPLLEAIQAIKTANEQAIVFQNRKGYVPVLSCNNCGWHLKCISCDISLTYYKSQNIHRCNYCGYLANPVSACAQCGSKHLEFSGFGTERIEEDLALFLPELRTVRFDQDSTRGKYAYHKIIESIESREVDVVVGTQMLAKGLDFEKLMLVAVVDADKLLSYPDFRSHERTFQLLTQLAGRAGRRENKGQVLIQTNNTKHPVWQFVLTGDYNALVDSELPEREKFNYPPFSRLIRVVIKHKDVELAKEAAQILAKAYKTFLGARVLGPQVPYISRLRNFYLQHIIIKLDNSSRNSSQLKLNILAQTALLLEQKAFKQLVVYFDVDTF